MLVAIDLNRDTRVEAGCAERGPQYVCPVCRGLVHIHKGQKVVHHFKHAPGAACAASAGETREHLRAKDFLAAGFRARGIKAEVEWPVLSIEGDRRADVVVFKPDTDQRVAFEVQHSPIVRSAISRRTQAYISAGVPVVWIAIYRRERLGGKFKVRGTEVIHVPRFNASDWENWAHRFYDDSEKQERGHLWFLDPLSGEMWRGWFSPHYLYRESREWYDSSGDYHSAPGGHIVSDRYRTLDLEGPYTIASLRVKLWQRHSDVKSGGLCAWLLAPTDINQTPQRPPVRLRIATSEHGFDFQCLEVRQNGMWVSVERDKDDRCKETDPQSIAAQ